MSTVSIPETMPNSANPFLDEAVLQANMNAVPVEQLAGQLATELMPPSSPNALGALTVELALKSSAEVINGNQDHEQPNPYHAFQLNKVRETYYFANEKAKKMYGEVLLSENIPEWLLQPFGGKDVSPTALIDSFNKQVVNERTQESKPVVSDESLTNLLQWHNHVQGEKQKVFEAQTIAPMRERMIGRMQQAEAEGWIKSGTLSAERIELINRATVYIDDKMGLDDKFHGFMGMAHAYAKGKTEWGDAQIVMSDPTVTKFSLAKLEKVFTHEMVHVLTGQTPHLQSYDDRRSIEEQQADRNDKGGYGMSRLVGENEAGTGLNEAVTEHFARALISGNIDKLQPLGGSYNGQRYLLRALCRRGKQSIDPRIFVQAMFADTPNSDRTITAAEPVELTDLRTALSDAYPTRNIPEEIKHQLSVASMAGGLVVGPVRKFAKTL